MLRAEPTADEPIANIHHRRFAFGYWLSFIGYREQSEHMSRIRYLVSYDISNPKRLRKVARSLEGFTSFNPSR